jgi:hypothetical protein
VRLRQRRPQAKWTPVEVARDVEGAFYGDSGKANVRAAAIVRFAYERMSKKDLADWTQAAENEHPGRGLPTYGIFKFDFDEGDRVTLYMEHDRSVLIREVESAFGDLHEAGAKAAAWVGSPYTQCHFENIPGVYQAALIESMTGVERSWSEFEMSWWLPGEEPYVPFRKYPPRTDELDEDDDRRFVLMPADVGEAMYRAFLNSPTLASEYRRAGLR